MSESIEHSEECTVTERTKDVATVGTKDVTKIDGVKDAGTKGVATVTMTSDQYMMALVAAKRDLMLKMAKVRHDPNVKTTVVEFYPVDKDDYDFNEYISVYRDDVIKLVTTLHELGIGIDCPVDRSLFSVQFDQIKFNNPVYLLWLPDDETEREKITNRNTLSVHSMFEYDYEYLLMTAPQYIIYTAVVDMRLAPEIIEYTYSGKKCIDGEYVHMYLVKVKKYPKKLDIGIKGYAIMKLPNMNYKAYIKWPEVRETLTKMVSKLHNHVSGIIHGNLCHENIVMDEDGKNIRFIGWGDAHYIDKSLPYGQRREETDKEMKVVESLCKMELIEGAPPTQPA